MIILAITRDLSGRIFQPLMTPSPSQRILRQLCDTSVINFRYASEIDLVVINFHSVERKLVSKTQLSQTNVMNKRKLEIMFRLI
jgi:hypothetical protein